MKRITFLLTAMLCVSLCYSQTDTVTKIKTDTVYITKPESFSSMGKSDADHYYKRYSGARTATILTTMLFGPITGLAPAILCSTIPVSKKRLGIKSQELMDNKEYYDAYSREAKHIKSRKVWRSYAVGFLVFIAIVGAGVAAAAGG